MPNHVASPFAAACISSRLRAPSFGRASRCARFVGALPGASIPRALVGSDRRGNLVRGRHRKTGLQVIGNNSQIAFIRRQRRPRAKFARTRKLWRRCPTFSPRLRLQFRSGSSMRRRSQTDASRREVFNNMSMRSQGFRTVADGKTETRRGQV